MASISLISARFVHGSARSAGKKAKHVSTSATKFLGGHRHIAVPVVSGCPTIPELLFLGADRAGVSGELSDTVLSTGPGLSRFHFDLDCHSPRTAPVGSRMKLRRPMPITSVTSFMTSAPNDFAF